MIYGKGLKLPLMMGEGECKWRKRNNVPEAIRRHSGVTGNQENRLEFHRQSGERASISKMLPLLLNPSGFPPALSTETINPLDGRTSCNYLFILTFSFAQIFFRKKQKYLRKKNKIKKRKLFIYLFN